MYFNLCCFDYRTGTDHLFLDVLFLDKYKLLHKNHIIISLEDNPVYLIIDDFKVDSVCGSTESFIALCTSLISILHSIECKWEISIGTVASTAFI